MVSHVCANIKFHKHIEAARPFVFEIDEFCLMLLMNAASALKPDSCYSKPRLRDLSVQLYVLG